MKTRTQAIVTNNIKNKIKNLQEEYNERSYKKAIYLTANRIFKLRESDLIDINFLPAVPFRNSLSQIVEPEDYKTV